MNPIQSKIEQTAKEYLTYKAFVDKEGESAKKEKDILAEKVKNMKPEEIPPMYFEKFGSLELLIRDMLQLKSRLYNEIDLVKDIIEIPKEIKDLVVDYEPIYNFAIIGDEKKIVNKDVYEQYKKDYILGVEQMLKMNK